VVALDLSRRTAGLNPVTEGAIVELLKRTFPRLKFPRVAWARASKALGADKKTTSGRNVWIIIQSPGRPGHITPSEADVRRSIVRARHVWS
jgi:3-dehydroquinate synthetase